jgi:hypothetical protein
VHLEQLEARAASFVQGDDFAVEDRGLPDFPECCDE